MLEIHQFPCLDDNYGFLLHDPDSGETVCIDTPDADEYLRQAGHKGWTITQIWNTHWHQDHAGGNAAIKAATGCTVVASAAELDRTPEVDRTVSHGDTVAIGAYEALVIDVGGHTAGHIAYHLPQAGAAFVGDAVFALGCGRMFEGTAPQFWASLSRSKALPADTLLYCAHEYTQGNARFAVHADPDNAELEAYAEAIDRARSEGRATVPFPLARDLRTNPFLRADDPALQARWGGGDAVETFAALREAKNTF
ncbi:MAG TPA: hydroxyacylglutathione hydrolase [Novosphingobium sp.]|nr:hydroxyacylglutathione hydrolase [Novosphingobium sp.]